MFDGFLGAGLAGASYLGAHQTNKANRGMAREAMAFSERMANTQYQRAVADMKAAGINPMLAAKLGGSASPSGTSAQMQDEIGSGVNSAMSARRAQVELANMREQNRLISAQVNATNADAMLKIASAKQVGLGYLGNTIGSKGVEAIGGLLNPILAAARESYNFSKPAKGSVVPRNMPIIKTEAWKPR